MLQLSYMGTWILANKSDVQDILNTIGYWMYYHNHKSKYEIKTHM